MSNGKDPKMELKDCTKAISAYVRHCEYIVKSPPDLNNYEKTDRLRLDITELLKIKSSEIEQIHKLDVMINCNRERTEKNCHCILLQLGVYLLRTTSQFNFDDVKNLLSVNDSQNLRKLVGFLVHFGIKPNLIAGITLDFNQYQFHDRIIDKYIQLTSVLKCLIDSWTNENVKTLVMKHLHDILAGFIQVSNAPLKKVEDENIEKNFSEQKGEKNAGNSFKMTTEIREFLLNEQKQFQSQLENILVTAYEPDVIKELIILLRNDGSFKKPAWFIKATSKHLTNVYLKPLGLSHLLRALFPSDHFDSGEQWKQLDTLVKIVVELQKSHPTNYWTNIFEQMFILRNIFNVDVTQPSLVKNFSNSILRTLRKNDPEIFDVFVKKIFCSLIDTEVTEIPTKVINDTIENIAFFFISNPCMNMEFFTPFSLFVFFIHTKLDDFCLDQAKLTRYILANYLKSIKSTKNSIVKLHEVFRAFLFNDSDFIHKVTNLIGCENENQPGIVIKRETCACYDLDLAGDGLYALTNGICQFDLFVFLIQTYCELCEAKSENTNRDLLELEDTEFIDPLTKRKLVSLKLLQKLIQDKGVLEELEDESAVIVDLLIKLLKTSNEEIIFTCIMVVEILDFTKISRQKKDELVEKLNHITEITDNEELKDLIHSITQTITFKNRKTAKSIPENNELTKAFLEINDPSIPVQAHGLITLKKLIENRHPEAIARKQYILLTFTRFLKHEDTYLYLNAINGLATLTCYFAGDIIPMLTDEYMKMKKNCTDSDNVELRLKYGEILVKCTRDLADVAVKYKIPLVNAVLCGLNDGDTLVRASSLSNLGEICECFHFKLGSALSTVLLALSQTIQAETEMEPKRACVFVIRKLLTGLGAGAIMELKDYILPIYRWLKQIYMSESDNAMKLQAQLALEVLNDVTKEFLRGTEQSLDFDLFRTTKIDVKYK